MDQWLEFARGPVFVFSVVFMVFGLIRLFVLMVIDVVKVMLRAGDKSLPYKSIVIETLKWVFPIKKIRNQFVFSLTSILFHFAILIVPVFLGGHIVLWSRGVGLSWPALPNWAADIITIIAIITAIMLVLQRLTAKATKAISRLQDYVIPVIISFPFISGFLLMHPSSSPFEYNSIMLMHVMSANLVLILIPITKLSHASLITSVQLVSEAAWHWPADSGSKVELMLGKKDEKI